MRDEFWKFINKDKEPDGGFDCGGDCPGVNDLCAEIANLQAEITRLREELEAVYEAWEHEMILNSAQVKRVFTGDRYEWRHRTGGEWFQSSTAREAIRAYVATRKEMKK